MQYPVHILSSEQALSACPLFSMDHWQWTCRCHPQAVGRLGYLPGIGFLLRMDCAEADPRRVYTAPQSPVCQDSAMEAFFTFSPVPAGEKPSDDCMYLNFEMNANGAMHAKYGAGRKGRVPLSEAMYNLCHCHAALHHDRWSVSLLIPLALLHEIYGITGFSAGSRFFCNFYKICEDPALEHYASFHPIDSETPNFHRPSCFAEAVLISPADRQLKEENL